MKETKINRVDSVKMCGTLEEKEKEKKRERKREKESEREREREKKEKERERERKREGKHRCPINFLACLSRVILTWVLLVFAR